MSVVCLGVSHRTAPLTERESLSFSDAERERLYSRLDMHDLEARVGIAEVAVLSTCNRFEIYAASSHRDACFEGRMPLVQLFRTSPFSFGIPDRANDLYAFHDVAAVRHLSRVAAGLDSLVLGESEILGQVRSAYEHARAKGVTGPVLEAAFLTAIATGRRARAATPIGQKPASISSEAIHLAEQMAGPLVEKRILIVGSGRMGRRAGNMLRRLGVRRLSLIGRTREHVAGLARHLGATALGWHQLGTAMAEADVVFATTGAPHAVISRDSVESALQRRTKRPILFVDIAVPRDVEPSTAALPGVQIVDLDDLQARVDGHIEHRKHAIPHVEAIVEAGVRDFEERQRLAEVRPFLAAFRSHVEQLRVDELHKSVDLRNLPPAIVEELDRFSQSLTNKLLHRPMHRLRQEADPERRRRLTDGMRDLFGIEE